MLLLPACSPAAGCKTHALRTASAWSTISLVQGIYVPKSQEEGVVALEVNTFCVHGGPGGRLSGIQASQAERGVASTSAGRSLISCMTELTGMPTQRRPWPWYYCSATIDLVPCLQPLSDSPRFVTSRALSVAQTRSCWRCCLSSSRRRRRPTRSKPSEAWRGQGWRSAVGGIDGANSSGWKRGLGNAWHGLVCLQDGCCLTAVARQCQMRRTKKRAGPAAFTPHLQVQPDL